MIIRSKKAPFREFNVPKEQMANESNKSIRNINQISLIVLNSLALVFSLVFLILQFYQFYSYNLSIFTMFSIMLEIVSLIISIKCNIRVKSNYVSLFISTCVALFFDFMVLAELSQYVLSQSLFISVIILLLTKFIISLAEIIIIVKTKSIISLISSLLVVAVLFSVAVASMLTTGFSSSPKLRGLDYELIQGDNQYEVAGIMPGFSKEIVIGDKTENGGVVSRISYAVFCDESIDTITINSTNPILIYYDEKTDAELSINKDLTILVNKKIYDSYRNLLYFTNTNITCGDKEKVEELVEYIVPNLKEGEVYISFEYDDNNLIPSNISKAVIPTWFGKEGEMLILESNYSSYMPYIANSDDLEFCYNSLNKSNLHFKDKDAANEFYSLNNAKISSSMTYKVSFEYVSKVTVSNTGDLFDPDWNDTDYYVSLSSPKLDTIDFTRLGCTADWTFNSTSYNGSFYDYLLKNTTSIDIKLEPTWSVKTPVIDNVVYGDNNAITYGDDLKFTPNVRTHELPLSYELFKGEESILTTSNVDELNLGLKTIADANGTYSIKVTATDLYNNQLKATVSSQNIVVSMQRKVLNVNWLNTDESFVFNNEEQGLVAEINSEQLVNGDSISLIKSNMSNINADTYTASVSINDDNYKLLESESTYHYTIAKKDVVANWVTVSEVVFDNQYHTATASFDSGIVAIGSIDCIVAGSFKDYAKDGYTFVASTSNNNFNITNSTKPFMINKKEVAVVWSNTTKTYNGRAQSPTAVADSGIAEIGNVQLSIDEYTHASSTNYTVNATSLNNNFKLSNSSTLFTINPFSIEAQWGSITFTYNGLDNCPTAKLITGSMDGDINLVVTGQAKNASDTPYVATIENTNTDYTITNLTKEFTINKKAVSVNWQNTSFTYDGFSHAPSASFNSGTADGVIVCEVSGDKINASSENYTATASTSNTNYTITERATQSFTIQKKSVSVNWSNTQIPYDGEAHLPTAVASGIASDGNLILSFTTDEKTNAGNYTATVTQSNTNYELINSTIEFSIMKKRVTIDYSNTSFEYDGLSHVPTAVAQGISGKLSLSMTTTANVNAGTYQATFTQTDTNYELTNPSVNYTISALEISVSFSNTSFVYDGLNHIPTATASGIAADGQIALQLDSTGHTNVGEYYVTATTNNSNYILINNTTAYEITAQPIDITWPSVTSYIYEDEPINVSIANTLPDGVTVRYIYKLGLVEVNATEINQAGNYTVKVVLDDEYKNNYTLTNDTFDFEVVTMEA